MDKLPRAVCILVPWEGKFLSVSRRNRTDLIGLPGGKVDPGETDISAAYRELREETGLRDIFMYPAFTAECGDPRKDTVYSVTTYMAMQWRGTPTSSEEGLEVRWATREELEAGPFAEYNKALFAQLEKVYVWMRTSAKS